jgi:succinoglycan biosynthesis transport protein ExoP
MGLSMLGDHEPEGGDRRMENAPAPRRGTGGAGAVVPVGRYPSYDWGAEDAGAATGGMDLQKYLRIVMRHWLIIAAAVVVCIGLAIGKTLLTTPIYTATGTIQIDREAARVSNLQTFEAKESVGNNADEFFQTQFARLKSRSLAEATAKDPTLDLAHDQAMLKGLGIQRKDQAPLTTAQAQSALASFIQGNLRVAPVQRSRIVAVGMDSPSGDASARLANAVVDNFIRQNMLLRSGVSAGGVTFLQEQLAEEKAKLEASERQLAEYARQEQIINIPSTSGPAGPGAGSGGSSGANQTLATSSLSSMSSALNEARAARIAAQQKYEIGRAAIGPNSPEVLGSGVIQDLKRERAKLQTEYDGNLATYQPTYAIMQEAQSRIRELDRRIEAETRSVQSSVTGTLEAQYKVAVGQEQRLGGEVSKLTGSVLDLRTRSIQYDILQREVDTNHQLYDSLLQKYKEIGISGNLTTNNISKLDPAVNPGYPSKPKPVSNLMLGAFVGLVLGLILAILREVFDASIRAPEDVEQKLGMPMLGSVPKLEKGMTPALAMEDVRSSFSEAYYSIRTALQFSTNEGVPSSLVVTSARPAEGKSTTASALAKNLARLGSRVLLIDADLRNPSLHRVMKLENTQGFSNYLTGSHTLLQVAQKTEIPNLSFVACGPLPPNPAELLSGHRLDVMLKEAREFFDVVIIDAPPVMGLADAPLLASAAAGTILAVEAGGTGRHLANASIRRLSMGNARLLGVVLTKFDARKGSYGYGYGYGYAYDYQYGSNNQKAIGKK